MSRVFISLEWTTLLIVYYCLLGHGQVHAAFTPLHKYGFSTADCTGSPTYYAQYNLDDCGNRNFTWVNDPNPGTVYQSYLATCISTEQIQLCNSQCNTCTHTGDSFCLVWSGGGGSEFATCLPPTPGPTKSPITSVPTAVPTTSNPSLSPTTSQPTQTPSKAPTTSNPTASPSKAPTTSSPSSSPTTSVPSPAPTSSSPTAVPTASPTTSTPSIGPTVSPTKSPVAMACRPRPTMKKNQCVAIAKYCGGIGVTIKWGGTGCAKKSKRNRMVRASDGGCQCQGYCGYTCADACRKDAECAWKYGKCWNKQSGLVGVPITQCIQ